MGPPGGGGRDREEMREGGERDRQRGVKGRKKCEKTAGLGVMTRGDGKILDAHP